MSPTLRIVLASLVVTGYLSATVAISAAQSSGTVVGNRYSGAKVGAYTSLQLGSAGGYALTDARPSEIVGIFSSLYLAQGQFLPAQSALTGIEAQKSIIRGFTSIEDSETYSLLKEFAAIIQTDIADNLNRSSNRAETLDAYVTSLENILTLAKRKLTELETLEGEQNQDRRAKKEVRDDLDRLIDRALRNDDFETAGANQEKLTEAERMYAEADTKQRQTERAIKNYEDLIEVAEERLDAIAQNRKVIIAGLKVIDVPGIEDFEILEE